MPFNPSEDKNICTSYIKSTSRRHNINIVYRWNLTRLPYPWSRVWKYLKFAFYSFFFISWFWVLLKQREWSISLWCNLRAALMILILGTMRSFRQRSLSSKNFSSGMLLNNWILDLIFISPHKFTNIMISKKQNPEL